MIREFARARLRRAVIALALLAGTAGSVAANGWEHGAVPFAALVKALSFDGPVIRRQAALSLGFRAQPEAVAPLLARLAVPEPDAAVRHAIYQALGAIGAPHAVPALATCLEREAEARLRAACVQALGGTGTNRALHLVLATLEREQDRLVRSHAVDALGAFDTKAAVDALAALIELGADAALRDRAIPALGHTGSDAAAGSLLAALSRAPNDATRLAIVQALADVGSPAATEALTALLESTGDARLRAAIVIALGASRERNATATLVAMLDDPVPAVRYLAVESLERLAATDAAPALATLAQREARKIADRDAADLVEDVRTTVALLSLQTRALRTVAALDTGAAADALLAAAVPREISPTSAAALDVASAIYMRRRVALYGLGYVGTETQVQAAAVLTGPAGLGDRDPRLRAVAVRSLGVLAPPDASATLRPLLDDHAVEVRMTAARVLGRLADGGSKMALVAALSDHHALVREEAALALGYLSDARAAAALRRTSRLDASPAVRDAAAYALTLLAHDP